MQKYYFVVYLTNGTKMTFGKKCGAVDHSEDFVTFYDIFGADHNAFDFDESKRRILAIIPKSQIMYILNKED